MYWLIDRFKQWCVTVCIVRQKRKGSGKVLDPLPNTCDLPADHFESNPNTCSLITSLSTFNESLWISIKSKVNNELKVHNPSDSLRPSPGRWSVTRSPTAP